MDRDPTRAGTAALQVVHPAVTLAHYADLPGSIGSEDKALSALAAGLWLPRPTESVTDASLTAAIEPLLDDNVRRELRTRRVLEAGKPARRVRSEGQAPGAFAEGASELFLVETVVERRERQVEAIERAVAVQDFGGAAKLQVGGLLLLPLLLVEGIVGDH